MKKILCSFLAIFGLAAGCFSLQSCARPDFLWCTSSGIVTYNRHTGQFEMLWENAGEGVKIVHDTIYICPDSVSIKARSR